MFAGSLILPTDIAEIFPTLTHLFLFDKVYLHLGGKDETTFWIMGAFVVIIFLKNSNTYTATFQPNRFYGLLFTVFSLGAVLNLTHISEFLYFNF